MNDFGEILKTVNDALYYKNAFISQLEKEVDTLRPYEKEAETLREENEQLKARVHKLESILRETSVANCEQEEM